MTPFSTLLYELDAETGILLITLNRPDKLNALNAATIEDIRTAVQRAQDDPEVRGIILTGSGEKAFVAGADIAELTKLDEISARRASERGQEAFCMIEESSKPVIAAVNGFALGGGCELAMACHIRVAAENARFGQPEVNLGLIPGYGGTQRLAQLVGKGKAIELLLTADMVKADEALRLGLVNHVVPQAELLGFCRQLLTRILTKAPLAVGLVPRLRERLLRPGAPRLPDRSQRICPLLRLRRFPRGHGGISGKASGSLYRQLVIGN